MPAHKRMHPSHCQACVPWLGPCLTTLPGHWSDSGSLHSPSSMSDTSVLSAATVLALVRDQSTALPSPLLVPVG